MSLAPGTVLVVQWPNSDGQASKGRPAVVVSSTTYNSNGTDVLIALITSNLARQDAGDIPILDSDPEFKRTKLRESSVIRAGKLMTFDTRNRHQVLGRIPNRILSNVLVGIIRSLAVDDLNPPQPPAATH